MDYYSITAHPYTFHAIVQLPKKGKTWRIQIGGHKVCVIFNVEIGRRKLTAYMEGMSFYPECAVGADTPLVRKSGTIRLLKASLTVLFGLLPNIDAVYFKDTSRIDCNIEDDYNDKSIQLNMYYVSKKGRTWYEETIGARLEDKLMKVYKVQKRSALGVYQEKHGFDDFIDDYMKYVVDVFPPEVMDIIRRAYESNRTYKGMFMELATMYDCAIMYGWLEKYFRKNVPLLFGDVEWHVSRDLFEMAQISVQKIDEPPAMAPLPHFGGTANTKRKPLINIVRKQN